MLQLNSKQSRANQATNIEPRKPNTLKIATQLVPTWSILFIKYQFGRISHFDSLVTCWGRLIPRGRGDKSLVIEFSARKGSGCCPVASIAEGKW
ncbi:hypothetical protein AKJ16_DCAP18737 [Drosera capensis]